jgi:Meiotically up-regulated gene 113
MLRNGAEMRDHIICEIRRLAAENGGKAPGKDAFKSATGIPVSKWLGKIWVRWGDALSDAGFFENELSSKSDAAVLLNGVAAACRQLGRYPSMVELKFLKQTNPSIPHHETLRKNFGDREGLLQALNAFVSANSEYADVLAMLPEVSLIKKPPSVNASKADGNVYLIKFGEYYKIGRGEDLEKRVKQVLTALPSKGELVHFIKTDDPSGIEANWHRRFKESRANGEYFKLSASDVKAFLRRSFQ